MKIEKFKWIDDIIFWYRIKETKIEHGLYNENNECIGYYYQGNSKGFSLVYEKR